ncbi:hypothetical protein PR003_g12547 [Phytophthora rubi]|uniref:Uncharacterized protein n=1 Tax=Phytophthora rubi TaxID=129364 RepID=A0A6A4FI23_9STRA|nr:hypothetical protein PR002_g12180 [Phytophthora rubi]KAE9028364.1 hypothetical protein PR001_g11756 [Phytophthora rubi]KAE9336362.1 hypothetical protein PR003_g12547 [Phytophthora rubi]
MSVAKRELCPAFLPLSVFLCAVPTNQISSNTNCTRKQTVKRVAIPVMWRETNKRGDTL